MTQFQIPPALPSSAAIVTDSDSDNETSPPLQTPVVLSEEQEKLANTPGNTSLNITPTLSRARARLLAYAVIASGCLFSFLGAGVFALMFIDPSMTERPPPVQKKWQTMADSAKSGADLEGILAKESGDESKLFNPLVEFIAADKLRSNGPPSGVKGGHEKYEKLWGKWYQEVPKIREEVDRRVKAGKVEL